MKTAKRRITMENKKNGENRKIDKSVKKRKTKSKQSLNKMKGKRKINKEKGNICKETSMKRKEYGQKNLR